MFRIGLTVVFLSIVLTGTGQINQWRGPNRDGIFDGSGLLKKWPESGPKLIIETEGIGKGYSSPIFANNTIYVTGMKDTLDYLTALDTSGKIIWQVPFGRSWTKSFPETRSSPTIDGDRLYVLSKWVCMDWDTGEIKYETDWNNFIGI